ncbi:MAG: hypothetical protein JW818_10405 [Pirellulales bacterium]|nr:hypothetical protein [Pirellulales bacterium]
MNESHSSDQVRRLWNALRSLVSQRAPLEAEITARYAEEKAKIEKETGEARGAAAEAYQTHLASLASEYEKTRRGILDRAGADHAALAEEYRLARRKAETQYKKSVAEQKKIHKEARWEATAVFEATRDEPGKQQKKLEEQVDAQRRRLSQLAGEAESLLRQRHQQPDTSELPPSPWPEGADPTDRFNDLISQAQRQWTDLADQRIARQFEAGRPFLYLVLAWILAVGPSIGILGWSNWLWLPASLVTAAALWSGLITWLYRRAKTESQHAHAALRQTLSDAKQAASRVLEAARPAFEQQTAAISKRLQDEMSTATKHYSTAADKLHWEHQAALDQIDAVHPPRLSEVAAQREKALERLEKEHAQHLKECDEHHNQRTEQVERECSQRVEEHERAHREAWEAMAKQWREGMHEFRQGVEALSEAVRKSTFDWNTHDPSQWRPLEASARAIPFGRLHVDLARMDGGLPSDERLRPDQTVFGLPALIPFPDRPLLFKAEGEGRTVAVETLQTVMLRMLTSIRPGKVRFMVFDPVGLGENFSAFMHLADYEERAISSRIWTESSHIEQQLTALTEHMENVIQVYLRNEFKTIQEYNDFAGEMAEPYHVLVVANFPAGFTESAARRLLSIVSSGARCGVHAMVSVDSRLKLPHNFDLADLENQALELVWRKDRFVWNDRDLADLPLELDRPPESQCFTPLVRAVGEHIRDAEQVEVPFACITPENGALWQGDTARELNIPLGRAGAMKLQQLSLGHGTAQHVLIAGKTGSGKSNLLNTIITNTALWYGPDQVQLYLVDFKKGVEFKPYAERGLPHARVVAIESEREFGLSVLEGLDAELKRRGDLFRELGVQNLAGFRRDRPDQTMPRVLLVIDEFQELFVEDDRIAQNAALLLDRLVRQGRAFGMHVLLGSQTLAGAYSLPRATLGQMAVRIALQCSDADAHLILSEENTAARLLSRPGEAIYNDANGLFEGNHPFQVVWLPDHERLELLEQIRDWAETHEGRAAAPIVFEGNAAADPAGNRLLAEAIVAPDWPEATQPVPVWLGAAVAIKDPTSVTFHRQGGSNLLLVGHREESALGILSTSLLALAAQIRPPTADGAETPPATFYILDGARPETPFVGYWAKIQKAVPHDVRLAGPREASELIGELAAELQRRRQANLDHEPPIYLVVHDLSRFRELRRAEESFSFSSLDEDQPPSPAKQFAEILRDGSVFGLHTLIWCDTCNTLGRWLDRQSVHDLELRVVFQMSAGDSSTLIDSGDAGRLGPHRAIFYDEGLGQMEKFRPYGPPTDAWLAQVKTRLVARVSRSKP